MHLVQNWPAVLKHAWSVRIAVIAALLSVLELVLPLVAPLMPVPDNLFSGLAAIVSLSAGYARLVAQKPLARPPAEPDWEHGDPR